MQSRRSTSVIFLFLAIDLSLSSVKSHAIIVEGKKNEFNLNSISHQLQIQWCIFFNFNLITKLLQ